MSVLTTCDCQNSAVFVRRIRGRLAALGVGAAMVLAACGGSDDMSSGAVASGGVGPAEDVSAVPSDAASESQADGGGDVLTTGGVDLGDETVAPAAEIETNRFPDLVVDDVGRGKKVNLRNLIPADKPVLLWMYAPH